MQTNTLQIGEPTPMGASLTEHGVNFAVYAGNATAVKVVLFDRAGKTQLSTHDLHRGSDGVWHGLLPDARVGTVYGFRAAGPYEPENGHRYDVSKLLLDPYAQSIVGTFAMTDVHLDQGGTGEDNAIYMVKGEVVDANDFDWQDDARPATPMAETVLYEVHVKGFTQQHPGVPAEIRGTYGALASPAVVEHLKQLGITAINLLPVHYHIDEGHLIQRGKVNYWGYNTLGFFAVDPRYANEDPRAEFRQMVRDLHGAGIEVILDVVYNHTAEGNEKGPTLSWRGLDNQAYYRLPAKEQQFYENHSGCGNTVDLSHSAALQMVIDSMRFWVEQMHVDGFRFDLAAILGRTDSGFDRDSAFFQEIRKDPVFTDIKLIAEPWDIGPNGYRFGQFPSPWSEWNDQFRRNVRGYWMQQGSRGDLASCLGGSGNTFSPTGRPPQASVNYVCAHDGFTLTDLVSYNEKHNEANGEDNRDGSGDNQSWNCGYEGASDVLGIVALRSRLKRAILATLFLSRGVPMLMAGDELGRSQQGNNNAYCLDNAKIWMQWESPDEDLLNYTSRLLKLRGRYEQLRSDQWLTGALNENGVADVRWLEADGGEVLPAAWHGADSNSLAMCLAGQRNLLVIFNGDGADQAFQLPPGRWQLEMDSALRDPFALSTQQAIVEDAYLMKARAVTVFGEVE